MIFIRLVEMSSVSSVNIEFDASMASQFLID